MNKHLPNSLRALFLSLAVLLSLPMLAVEVEIDGINYDLIPKGKVATVIKKSSDNYSGEVVIPETVEYNGTVCNVTSIGYRAFTNCSGLTSVTIPNSVTSIGGSAFYNCSGLTSVTIPNSVESIGSHAFEYCSGLTSVTIGNSVTSIGGEAFRDCSGLTSVTIGNSVTSIGERAFDGCSGLKSVHISDIAAWCNIEFDIYIYNSFSNACNSNPLYYAHYLYLNGEEVKDLVIPNSVTSIGDYAFYNCYGLTSVTIPNSVTSIGERAFAYCECLKSVHISDIAAWCNIEFGNYSANPLNFAYHLYLNGEEIKDLVIPNSVTSIKDYAFYRCDGLTSVTIPNSVTSIGEEAFYSCDGLTSVTIPNSVTSIGESAFSDCKGLTSVTIGNSVTSIGDWAFEGCYHLEKIELNCKNIGGWFRGIESIKEIIIGNSVTSIGGEAFYNCSGLTSVTIGNSVTSIGEGAFDYCSGLTSVHISDIAAWCNIDFGDNPLSYAQHLYMNGEEVKDLVIPNSVTSIGAEAFYNCDGLTSVTIPNSVTSIGEYAFRGCEGLTSVTIPNSVTSIGYYAFSGCKGLTSVHISDIAAWCNIDFEYSDSNPLSNAHHLYLNGEEVKDLIIPNSVTSIGDDAFYGCSGLTSVTIPNSVTSIGGRAFADCSGLTSVTIPNNVTSIGDRAFRDCSGLTSVTIGNSVTSIGDWAFFNCPDLLDVYCYAEKVPYTEGDAFERSYPEYATLHVPDASIESYKTTEPWSSFGKIVALTEEETGIDELKGENGKVKTAVYDLSGRRVQKAQKGIFIQDGKVMVK